jgi:hypothetical protein
MKYIETDRWGLLRIPVSDHSVVLEKQNVVIFLAEALGDLTKGE